MSYSTSPAQKSSSDRREYPPVNPIAEVKFSVAEFYLYLQLYSSLDLVSSSPSTPFAKGVHGERGKEFEKKKLDISHISLQIAEQFFKVLLQLDLTLGGSGANVDENSGSERLDRHFESQDVGPPQFLRYIDGILSRIQVIVTSYIKINIANNYYDFMSQYNSSSSSSSGHRGEDNSSKSSNNSSRLSRFKAILSEIINKIISEITILFNFWTILMTMFNTICLIYCDKSSNLTAERVIKDIIKSLPNSAVYPSDRHQSFSFLHLLTSLFLEYKISTRYDYSNNFAIFCYLYEEVLVSNIMIIRAAQDTILIELKLMEEGSSYSDNTLENELSGDEDNDDMDDPLMKLRMMLGMDGPGHEGLSSSDSITKPSHVSSIFTMGGDTEGADGKITNDFFISAKFVSFAFLSRRKDNLFELLVEHPIDSLLDDLSSTDEYGIRLTSNSSDFEATSLKTYNIRNLASLDKFILLHVRDGLSICFGDLYHNSIASTISNRIENDIDLIPDMSTLGRNKAENSSRKTDRSKIKNRSYITSKTLDRHDIGVFWNNFNKYVNILQILVTKKVVFWYFCQDDFLLLNEKSCFEAKGDDRIFRDTSALTNSNFLKIRKVIERVTLHNYRSTKDSMLLLLEMVVANLPWTTIITFVKSDKRRFATKLFILINLVDREKDRCEALLEDAIFTNAGIEDLLEKVIAYSCGCKETLASGYDSTNASRGNGRKMKGSKSKKNYLLLHGINKIKRIVVKIFQFSQECRRKLSASAFALVSQRKFQTAAGLFLLSSPPMISECSQILSNQYGSPDLGLLISRMAEENYFSETFVRVGRLLTLFCNLKSLLIVKKSSCLSIAGACRSDGSLNLKESDDFDLGDDFDNLKISDSKIWHSIFSTSQAYAIHTSSRKILSMYFDRSLILTTAADRDEYNNNSNAANDTPCFHQAPLLAAVGNIREEDCASDHYQKRLLNIDKSTLSLIRDIYLQRDRSAVGISTFEGIMHLFEDISNVSCESEVSKTSSGENFIKLLSKSMVVESSLLSIIIFIHIFSDFFKTDIEDTTASVGRSGSYSNGTCITSDIRNSIKREASLCLSQQLLVIILEYFKKIPESSQITRSAKIKYLKLQILSSFRTLGRPYDDSVINVIQQASPVEHDDSLKTSKFGCVINPFIMYSCVRVKVAQLMIGFNTQLLDSYADIWESALLLNDACLNSSETSSEEALKSVLLPSKQSDVDSKNLGQYGAEEDEDTIAAMNRLKKLAGVGSGGAFSLSNRENSYDTIVTPKTGLFNFASSSSSSSGATSTSSQFIRPRSMLDDFDDAAPAKPTSSGLFNFAKATSPSTSSSSLSSPPIKPRSMLDDF